MVAWILFVVMVPAVVLGITFIVAGGSGKALGSERIHPTIADK